MKTKNKILSKSKFFITLSLLVLGFFFYFSCAVQEPPKGGEDDNTPPKVVEINPPNNTVNFTGNKIRITFDEYVDRRSFKEALFISPKPRGEILFNWSGKEVEMEFSTPLEKNRTYVFIISKLLKDLNKGNPLTEPIKFAISTGNIIDIGVITGKVFDFSFIPPTSEIYRNLVVTAYKIDYQDINPEVREPDFVCPIAPDGKYIFNNLPYSKYRLFAIVDNDRDYLFSKDFDNIAVTYDVTLSQDSSTASNIDFIMDLDPKFITENCIKLWDTHYINLKGTKSGTKWFLNQIFMDSAGMVGYSIKNESDNLSVTPAVIIYVKGQKFSKLDLVSHTELVNISDNSKSLLNFFWVSDSIINLRPQEKLSFSSSYILKLRLNNQEHTLKFKTAPSRKFGSIKGDIYGNSQNKVIVFLINNENNLIYYSGIFDVNSKYEFKNIIEGNYTLFAFIDENEDGIFSRGNYFPYLKCEQFFIYPELVKVPGNWTLENININF